MVAQTFIGLKDFEDQLVHPVSVNMNIFKEPVKVISNSFKYKGELSEFSFSINDESSKQTDHKEGIMKHSRQSS